MQVPASDKHNLPHEDLSSFCAFEYERLVGMLGLYCGSREVAEELAQDTLVRVCADWEQVQKKDSPQAWTYRVAINLARSYFRRKSAERRALQRVAMSAPRNSASNEAQDNHAAPLRDEISRLPQRQRQVLLLRYYLDLSVRDSSVVLQCPESTIKTLTRRALQALGESDSIINQEIRDAV